MHCEEGFGTTLAQEQQADGIEEDGNGIFHVTHRSPMQVGVMENLASPVFGTPESNICHPMHYFLGTTVLPKYSHQEILYPICASSCPGPIARVISGRHSDLEPSHASCTSTNRAIFCLDGYTFSTRIYMWSLILGVNTSTIMLFYF